MGLRVNTNLFAMTAQRNLSATSERLGGNFSRLSSGLRIASASDDAAGLGVSERMRSQIRGLGQAGRNAQDGISLSQTAEGALNEVSGNLVRMRELAVQAANGTLSAEDRDVLDVEFQALDNEINRVATETEFNGINLLDGSSATTSIQVGLDSGDTIDITNQDARSATLGIASLDVDSAANASTALAAIDTAIQSVSTARGNLGASSNRLSSSFRSIQTSRENLSAAESRIRDVDVATETSDLTRNTILQQAAVSVLSQANVQPQLALSLIG
ncbi:flagellin [Engelhardtia mirabilis]|uniref:Flagellin n=1 Tax=Engelhardtia mirabilis TaxID=2528011 RepID=A0A518BSR7_9BACT|nr:Flagellin [Planctomycetes bacterium Pla133]QDV04339.1 Flagellin [Planctomycetes bacterium Pla86]